MEIGARYIGVFCTACARCTYYLRDLVRNGASSKIRVEAKLKFIYLIHKLRFYGVHARYTLDWCRSNEMDVRNKYLLFFSTK